MKMTQRDFMKGDHSAGISRGRTTDDNHNDFDAWRATYRTHLPGEYTITKGRNSPFTGVVRTKRVGGLRVVEVGSNAYCLERTSRDIRRDQCDHFGVSLLVSGRRIFSQNDREINGVTGDCALINMRRPFSYTFNENQFLRCVVLLMPRRLLTSTIGFESEGGVSWGSDTLAVRLLSHLILEAHDCNPVSASAEYHMQLAVCDLLGAMMASNDLLSYSSHKEKMFARIMKIVRHHFTDPEIGPREIASEAGISLRYLQKFFTARGTTCSRFIQSLRLNHAAKLVRFRNLTKSGQRLTDIAHVSGFQNYDYFARIFRHQFGHSPSMDADPDQDLNPPIG
jgi:AraC family transcriptional regulator, positive regulator of tynA and feaB